MCPVHRMGRTLPYEVSTVLPPLITLFGNCYYSQSLYGLTTITIMYMVWLLPEGRGFNLGPAFIRGLRKLELHTIYGSGTTGASGICFHPRVAEAGRIHHVPHYRGERDLNLGPASIWGLQKLGEHSISCATLVEGFETGTCLTVRVAEPDHCRYIL